MFAALRDRMRQIEEAPRAALVRAAARIEAKLLADAQGKRSAPPPGISVRATPSGIVVTAPAWVMKKARELGQPAEWAAIEAEELRAELRRGAL